MSVTTTATPRDAGVSKPAVRRPPRRWGRTLAWHGGCLAVLVVLLYPIAWLIGTSFKPPHEVLSSLSLLPHDWDFTSYPTALDGIGGTTFWTFLSNSLIVAIGAVLGNVISCSLAAYAFARLRFRLSGVMFAFMIGTIMLPHHVVIIPQYAIFQSFGLVDTFWPLILPKFLATDAFFVFLIVQFIRGLPGELDEAARMDGCGPFRTFWYVILPLIRPALITTTIFTFIWTWNDFFGQLLYLNSPEHYTLPLALRLFIDQTGTSQYGPMFAMSVLTLIPIALFFLAFQRLLVEGVSTTGLKG
jgi:multiple sugar transport system permease protein